jgi:hypothetical protein
MDTTNTIFKVRVDKTQMRDFPFDLFYLVPTSHKSLLPRLFPWALCVPMHDTLCGKIRRVTVRTIERVPHRHDRKEEPTSVPGLATLLNDTIDAQTYFVIVPILPLTTPHRYCKSWKRKQPPRSRVPTYLMAPHHAKEDAPKLTGILGDDTVIFTPYGPKRPVCLFCPRHLLHLQDKCHLGSNHCYNELLLKRSANDEQLQDDSPDADSVTDVDS